jgi:cytosine/adenosine deaminase-related metal-dependent hydrolase
LLLRARIILPITSAPIENGALLVRDGRVEQIGRASDFASWTGPVEDLGDVVLFPGFVNAHCHLDYTRMAGLLPPPREFSDWIKSILALKAHWSYTEYAASWLSGAQMLLSHGVTTVADIEAVPELIPDLWDSTPLRVHTLYEMTGVKSASEPQNILRKVLSTLHSLPAPGGECAGFSPHAPYSTVPELLRLTAVSARDSNRTVAIHCAESESEFQMFRHASGPLFDWLKKQRDVSDCGTKSPVKVVAQSGLFGPRCLAIHCNYLESGDADILAQTGTHVVHCPRSHAYFQHRPFPFHELREAGVNVCLGTDSLASVLKGGGPLVLDMFAELRIFSKNHPDVSATQILELATIAGARALGTAAAAGLAQGAPADFVTIPYAGSSIQAHSAVLHHQGPVRDSFISGVRVYGTEH